MPTYIDVQREAVGEDDSSKVGMGHITAALDSSEATFDGLAQSSLEPAIGDIWCTITQPAYDPGNAHVPKIHTNSNPTSYSGAQDHITDSPENIINFNSNFFGTIPNNFGTMPSNFFGTIPSVWDRCGAATVESTDTSAMQSYNL